MGQLPLIRGLWQANPNCRSILLLTPHSLPRRTRILSDIPWQSTLTPAVVTRAVATVVGPAAALVNRNLTIKAFPRLNNASPLLRFPRTPLVSSSTISMSHRRSKSTKATPSQVGREDRNPTMSPSAQPSQNATANGHSHSHSHDHSFFGHSHSHGEEGHSHGTESIIAALEGKGDRGSQITLVGLAANVLLTVSKGAAGWLLHSASLLADAGHSMSDLLGDFVVLFCWKLSRKPPTEKYPYGFAKVETVGTAIVSLLLIGGALGIGFHSYNLLLSTLAESATSMSAGPAQEILVNITNHAPPAPFAHEGHTHAVDPNAAWFAALSIVTKEWLYRITKTVADEEKSPVLLANAIHHRSDAYSSVVAFIAILGTWFFPTLPLDPIGGLAVSFIILKQGLELLMGAWGDITDAGVSPQTRRSLKDDLKPLISEKAHSAGLLAIDHVRARRSGSLLFVDLTAVVPGKMTAHETSALDKKIQDTLKKARSEIAEVRIKFEPRD